jgi:hypothetical protein
MALRDDVARLQILSQRRFELITNLVFGFGAAFIVFLYSEKNLPIWLSGVAMFIWMVVLFALYFFRAEKEARSLDADTLSRQARERARDEAINLMSRAMEHATMSLRTVTQELRQFVSERNHVVTTMALAKELTFLKDRMLRHLGKDLRFVFEGDTRGVDTTTWPHNFFKIALFEPKPTVTHPKQLERTFFDYPPGVEPSPDTQSFDLVQHSRAAVVLAFLQQDIVVIEDIKTESTKDALVTRWLDRRPQQARDYESMICAAIVSGTKGQPDRKCLGVLVIDTNRNRYFREERSFQAFLGTLLGPFRTILTFILELDAYGINSGRNMSAQRPTDPS